MNESTIWLATLAAFTLAAAAQLAIRLTWRQTERLPAGISGFAAARTLLDEAGLQDVSIEQVPGALSDHYEPRHRVLRLSGPVYHGRSLAAVGAAAHEAGHALQQSAGDLRVRLLGIAGMAAGLGSGAGIVLMLLGLGFPPLIRFGACVFAGAVLLQLLNLPTEFNAGRRADRRLCDMQLVDVGDLPTVRLVIRISALTYLAGTLQTMVSSLMRVIHYAGRQG